MDLRISLYSDVIGWWDKIKIQIKLAWLFDDLFKY